MSLAIFLAFASRAEAQIPHEILSRSLSAFAGRAGSVEVARSKAELESIWRELGNTDPVPEIDFHRHTVLAYFMGTRPTSRYDVDVKEISVRGGVLHVGVVETKPGPHCLVFDVVTAPAVALVTIPWGRTVLPDVATDTLECEP